jgi:hypothetical protein
MVDFVCLKPMSYIGTNSGLRILVQDSIFFKGNNYAQNIIFSNFNLKHVSFLTHAYINATYLGT